MNALTRCAFGCLLAACLVPSAAAQTRYVAFGDSITAGVGDETGENRGYPVRLQQLLTTAGQNALVVNRGVGGEKTPEGLSRLDEVLDEGGNVLLLMEGTNDVSVRIGIESTEDNLRLMGLIAESAGFSVIHATAIPRSIRARVDVENYVNQDMNQRIRRLAANRGRKLVDNFEIFGSQPNGLAELYYPGLDDFVGHPNARGYDLMARSFFEVITDVDAVGPVLTRMLPLNGATRVRRTTGIELELTDFGAGINLAETRLVVNGTAVDLAPTGDQRRASFRYQPPQPLGGVVHIGLRTRDLANPAHVVDREMGRFIIEGTVFLDGDFDRDGRVDGFDLQRFGRAFGSRLGDSRFSFLYDLNDDNNVTGADLALMAANFGRTVGQ